MASRIWEWFACFDESSYRQMIKLVIELEMIFRYLSEPAAAQCGVIARVLDRFSRLASAEQNSLVGRQLFDLLQFAMNHSAYWKKRLGQLTSGTALTDLLIMTRQDLKCDCAVMRTGTAAEPDLVNDSFLTRTSGSTGQPVEVLRPSALPAFISCHYAA